MLDALIAEARIRWGMDPAAGLQLVALERVDGVPIDAWRPLLLVPAAVLRAPATPAAEPLPGRHRGGRAGVAAILARLYPSDHPVGRIGREDGATVASLTGGDLAAPAYLAPLPREAALAGPWAMPWISDRLRRPDGCPWDREQTHRSLRKHLLEEAYEAYDALDTDVATPALAGELGDLLLQVVLHAQLAAEAGAFDLTDVEAAIAAKIVRRHPHVFADAEAHTASDVNRQWERIKADERAEDASRAAADAAAGDRDDPAEVVEPRGALDGISRSMPALAASQEMQDRAANLGYDWPDVEQIVDKLHEELGELREAATPEHRAEEVGDVLMVAVNLARRHGVEAESALQAGNEKFRRRFGHVERAAAARGVALRDLSFDELDALWDAAKVAEAAAKAAAAAAQEAAAADTRQAARAAEAADAALTTDTRQAARAAEAADAALTTDTRQAARAAEAADAALTTDTQEAAPAAEAADAAPEDA